MPRTRSVVLACALAIGCEAAGTTNDAGTDSGSSGSSSGGSDSSGTGDTEGDVCMSGLQWTQGNAESPLMHPGTDCIGCHQQYGEAEEYHIAGTVYAAPNEPDDCYGVAGVTVELTGADGIVVQMTTNSAGNFTAEHTTVATPFTAKLIYEGRERAMLTPQTVTSCNSCHGQVGLNLAPGRIVAP